ncbi:MAG: type IV toxin-antitoxin system AbiEi family antitoxin [Prevotellaceae bacterium]|nr:type IV toxin-antitoxin system AbiEi family antitoxin [Prevotellaceae bacterium]
MKQGNIQGRDLLYLNKEFAEMTNNLYLCRYIYIVGMKIENNMTKLQRLALTTPRSLVMLSSWLVSQGYPYELQQRYRKSGWLKTVGIGAMMKAGDRPSLTGAIAALQQQAGSDIHVGGRSALEWAGRAHYLPMGFPIITLFVENKSYLPAWFTSTRWDMEMRIYGSSLFRDDTAGLLDYQDGELTVKISDAARAIMECLSLCPHRFPLQEAYELMEGVFTFRPDQVQMLLGQCKSVKVKRLFLYFAEKAGHAWYGDVDAGRIDLGSGTRSLAGEESGVFVPKYQLVLPETLVEDDKDFC